MLSLIVIASSSGVPYDFSAPFGVGTLFGVVCSFAKEQRQLRREYNQDSILSYVGLKNIRNASTKQNKVSWEFSSIDPSLL